MSQSNYDFATGTFAFFRLISKRPAAVVSIAIWQIILYSLFTVGMIILFAPHLPAYVRMISDMSAGMEPDASEVLAFFSAIAGSLSLLMIFTFILTLMVQGAWMRLLTRNESGGFFPFRLGGDEGRLFVVNLLYVVFGFLLYIVIVLVLGLGLGIGAAVMASSDGGVTGGLIGGLLSFFVVLAVIVGVLILAIRFAAAPALTVLNKKISFFESWSATKGVVGWMFLSYLVVIVVAFLALIVLSIAQHIFLAGALVSVMEPIMALENSKDPSFEQVMSLLGDIFTSPFVIFAMVIMVVLRFIYQVFVEVSWHGVGAYAAVRYSGQNDSALASDDISAPSASVGEAPSEG